MSLSDYLDRQTDPAAQAILKEQHASAVEHNVICCGGCGWKRALTMAFRCLYCGVWFCHPCAEKHFGKTVAEHQHEISTVARHIESV